MIGLEEEDCVTTDEPKEHLLHASIKKYLLAPKRILIQFVKPSWAAMNKGDALSTVNKFILAPFFNSNFKQESFPYCAAVNIGVAPSVFCMLMFAPHERSNSMKS